MALIHRSGRPSRFGGPSTLAAPPSAPPKIRPQVAPLHCPPGCSFPLSLPGIKLDTRSVLQKVLIFHRLVRERFDPSAVLFRKCKKIASSVVVISSFPDVFLDLYLAAHKNGTLFSLRLQLLEESLDFLETPQTTHLDHIGLFFFLETSVFRYIIKILNFHTEPVKDDQTWKIWRIAYSPYHYWTRPTHSRND
nr:PREDICTED: uncharacterized protein LOC109034420 [Bemisia tabaci]